MIIRIQRGGKSFKWLGKYLTHDADKAKTSERVAWTDTINLANTHVGAAIDEMYWTYRAADQLKRAAGVSTGGTKLQNPVKHLSLNWHPSDHPTKDEMVRAVRDFMRHMGWQEHQAVLVAHNDRPHDHVHVMVNVVSPVDGRGLDAGYEWNRSEAWRVGYERDRFQILCEKSLLPYEQRDKTPTRDAWLRYKGAEQEFDTAEAKLAVRAPDYFDRHEPTQWKAKEWDALRDYQKEQRTDFFAEGKQAYREVRNAVFREVRTEFRDEWKTWFHLRKDGFDLNLLGEIKNGILERQNAELEKRRDEACKELREKRDKDYQDLLQQQRGDRAHLKERQGEDLRTYDFLDRQYEHDTKGPDQSPDAARARENLKDDFAASSRETTNNPEPEREERREHEPDLDDAPGQERHRVRDPLDAAGMLGLGALGAIASLADRLADGFMGGVSQKPQRQPPPEPKADTGYQHARATERQQRANDNLAEEAARLHEFWVERRRTRTRDRD